MAIQTRDFAIKVKNILTNCKSENIKDFLIGAQSETVPKTIYEYNTEICKFVEYISNHQNIDLNGENFDSNISKVEYKHIQQYRNYLVENYAKSSARKKFIITKSFITFLQNQSKIGAFNLTSIKDIKVPQKEVVYLTQDEVEVLLTHLAKAKDREALRDYTMVRLMLFYGLRGMEVRNIEISKIDFITGKLSFIGKGDDKQGIKEDYEDDKYSFVDLDDEMLEIIKIYLEDESRAVPKKECEEFLFTTRVGTNPSAKSIGDMLTRRMIESGFTEERVNALTPHKLRATLATQLSNSGVPSLLVQKKLRHKSLTTTSRYVGNDKNDSNALTETMMNLYTFEKRKI